MAEPRGGSPRPVPSGTTLYRGASVIATMSDELGDVKDGAIFVQGNEIRWVGPLADLPSEFLQADEVRECVIVIQRAIDMHCTGRCAAWRLPAQP